MSPFIRFLFYTLLPYGRLNRTAFAVSLVATMGLCLATLLGAGLVDIHLLPALAALIQLCLWIKCVLTGRRMHDIGLTGWLAAPGLVLFAYGITYKFAPDFMYGLYDQLHLRHTAEDIGNYFVLLLVAILIADLILCFIPGNKTANRFGPPPGQSAAPAQDVF